MSDFRKPWAQVKAEQAETCRQSRVNASREEKRYKVPTSAELAFLLRELSAELYAAAQLPRKAAKPARLRWQTYAAHAEAIAAVLDGTARSVPGDKV